MGVEWSTEELIKLRAVLLTQTEIQADWNWEKAQQDLNLLSELIGFRFEAYHEPTQAIQRSGLMSFEPDRSTQAQSKLPRFEQTAGRQRRRSADTDYDRSIISAALFLFDHLSGFKSDSLMLNISSLESDQPVLFKLITEFSKVYQARLMIYEFCTSDWAYNKLADWHQSLQTKKVDFYDDEPRRFERVKELFDQELSRDEEVIEGDGDVQKGSEDGW
ncbi:hypothetical protein MJO28_003507 [Puccinia striiformis f. sp. tritici]|uniref:Uncharacterized protein n=2 Tax=Puccinia striiformis f. sp. tritici TaxID=168172 RepID=A0A0L0VAY7_9BASI|nr:hypothetical protein Pst134EA_004594 [Puccinia striiformis f. sp. tritici]KAH9470667.1 hypothetical protein Pst134EA_004594 [Puccinia striiformis f. sp. tritici]KAI7959716.1 hypothetical protein MJO28_003507 [Puccinia striiformis f. sp. tritici]KAI9623295.1 hypothetical protein KEM48_009512 [Puccinia striiformis f. sp. tritici PST-130]KNE96149.1 hypothetical protein PSTG_10568 [Puccinia striiformis f. sp. tritici PST-78]